MFRLPRGAVLREASSGRRRDAPALRLETASKAEAWKKRGVRAGSRVPLEAVPGAGFVCDLLALWELGACVVPFDPALPREQREAILAGWGPRAERPDEALILQTSGTTAVPRGVVLTRRGLASRLRALRAAVPREALGRALCVLPSHHGHGLIGGLLLPLSAGAEVVVAPLGGASGFDLGAAVEEFSPSFVTAVPALWRAVLRVSRPPRRPALRRVHSASSPLSAALRRDVAAWTGGAELVDVYGMTETASWISGSEPGESREGVVGRGWGARLRVDAEGEVWVRCASLFAGYAGGARTEAGRRVGGWWRTGDRGVMERDGSLRLLGRLDDAIDRAGVTVQPEEVEAVVSAHPKVEDVCVFGLPHPIAGEEVAAGVVWKRGAAVAELERWCVRRLAPAKVPRRWFSLERMPRTPSGKLRRREVADICARSRPTRVSL